MRVSAPFDHPDTLVVVTFRIVVADEILLEVKTELKLQDLVREKEIPNQGQDPIP